MADDSSGEKTEKASPKKLRDARRRGDVPKSRDLGLALGLLGVVLMLSQLLKIAPPRLDTLLEGVLAAVSGGDFEAALETLVAESITATLLLSALVLLPIALLGLLVEFLQSGPVLAVEKLVPDLSGLDPVQGFKRMFGADNLVELLKSIVYTALLFGIGWHVVSKHLPAIMLTPAAGPLALVEAMLQGTLELFAWTLGVFIAVTALDIVWQRHSFAQKMMMSLKDTKDEHKNSEGDPQLKGQRRQLARQWSREGAKKSAASASVLVVNPTHVAIAILYDVETSPVPTVIGRGEDETALDMRDAAADAEVPVLRNETLARALLKDTEDGDPVPRDLFGIVAEVTLWALRARERMERERRGGTPDPDAPELPVPGDDLSRYPTRYPGSFAETDAADA